MLAQLTPAFSQAAAFVAGRLSGSSERCACLCECSASIDKELISVLEKQLARCGPEQLRATPATCSCPATPVAPFVTAGFIAGLLAGLSLTIALLHFGLLGRHGARGREAGPAGVDGDPPAGITDIHPVRPGGGALARAHPPRQVGRLVLGGPDTH